MNVIQGSIPKDKTAVFTAFGKVMEGRADSGTLFLAFPLVDVFGVTTAVDGLLISRENGLVVFDLEPGSSLDMEVVRPRQDDLYVGLHSLFIKQEGLRSDFAPFVPAEENGLADVYTSQEDLVAKLEELTSSPSARYHDRLTTRRTRL